VQSRTYVLTADADPERNRIDATPVSALLDAPCLETRPSASLNSALKQWRVFEVPVEAKHLPVLDVSARRVVVHEDKIPWPARGPTSIGHLTQPERRDLIPELSRVGECSGMFLEELRSSALDFVGPRSY
jgi:hypothetical protein